MLVRLDAIAIALVMAGVVMLLASLRPLGRVIRELPTGRTRRLWYVQGALTLGFAAGYIAYMVFSWGQHEQLHNLIVPLVFCLGACFVWLNFMQAMRTAVDVRRIALLERENITDALTGIYNRRHLDRRLKEAFEAARRHGHPLAVLILDIDHFKKINDQHGHAVGDLALRHLGQLCLDTVRASDVVARYGGEEIVVIAPHTTAAQGAELAERLRKKVATTPLLIHTEGEPRREVRFTLSIGVASLTAHDDSGAKLLERADQALYRAKAEGRNRVCTEVLPDTSASVAPPAMAAQSQRP